MEDPLDAGRGGETAVRIGDTVRRTTGPWMETVHAFLEHLREHGFDRVPEVLGVDERGREILTFIEGEVLADPAWRPGDPGLWPTWARTDESLVEVARLLSRLHCAAASFTPRQPVWRSYAWPELLPGEIVCHGDIGRHNTVYRDGRPWGFIDWDSIRPNQPILEFATAAWNFVPLGDDHYFSRSSFGARPDLPQRLALFAQEYDALTRSQVRWALQEVIQRAPEAMRYWPQLIPLDAAAYFDLVSQLLRWLDRSLDWLVSEI